MFEKYADLSEEIYGVIPTHICGIDYQILKAQLKTIESLRCDIFANSFATLMEAFPARIPSTYATKADALTLPIHKL